MSEDTRPSQRPQFEAILREQGMLHDGEVMTDAILVAAVERFDDSTGYARVYPEGIQPQHVSLGLLTECLDRLRVQAQESESD